MKSAGEKARDTRRARLLAKLQIPAADPSADDFAVCTLCGDFAERPHACESVLQARIIVAVIADVALRTWGTFWVEYCVGNIAKRPPREGLETRELELRLAEIGVADPLGFTYGAENVRGRKTKKRGKIGRLPDHFAKMLNDQEGGSRW